MSFEKRHPISWCAAEGGECMPGSGFNWSSLLGLNQSIRFSFPFVFFLFFFSRSLLVKTHTSKCNHIKVCMTADSNHNFPSSDGRA